MADDGLDAAWDDLVAKWDDDAAHDRFLIVADASGALPMAAKRYRAIADEAKKPRSERMLGRITALAVAKMEASRRPDEVHGTMTLVLRIFGGLLALLAIYATYRALTRLVGNSLGRRSRSGVTRFALAFALGSFLVGCGTSVPLAPKAVEMNRLGIEALANGDLPTAEARFSVALEYHPKFVEALVNLGLTELARGNHGRAKTLFLRAKHLNADVPHPHHGLGVLADKEGRRKEAAEHYRDALKVDPGFVPSRANLARDYFEASMLDEAREQFSRLTEVAAKDDRGPAGLVETLLRLHREDEADEVLGAARTRLGDTPRLAFLAGRRTLARGDADGARALLTPLTERESDVTTAALAWLAVADLAAKEPKTAVKHAEAALAKDQLDAVATFALAAALAAEGDPAAPEWKAHADELRSHGPMR